MSNTVYDKDNRYLPGTSEMAEEAEGEIRKLFEKYLKKGYSPRDISHILIHEVISCETENVL